MELIQLCGTTHGSGQKYQVPAFPKWLGLGDNVPDVEGRVDKIEQGRDHEPEGWKERPTWGRIEYIVPLPTNLLYVC